MLPESFSEYLCMCYLYVSVIFNDGSKLAAAALSLGYGDDVAHSQYNHP